MTFVRLGWAPLDPTFAGYGVERPHVERFAAEFRLDARASRAQSCDKLRGSPRLSARCILAGDRERATFLVVGSGAVAAASAGIRYDDSEWPIVVVTLPGHELSEAEFRENLREMGKYGERGGRFGFVVDTRGAPDPNADRRRAIAEFWDGCLRRYGEFFIGAAIVMSSSTGRAVFKAILWLRSSPLLLVPVATPAEGLEKLRTAASVSRQRIAR
jgi:hypothetical protein